LLFLSSDTAYKAQGCSVVVHVVKSTSRTAASLQQLFIGPLPTFPDSLKFHAACSVVFTQSC